MSPTIGLPPPEAERCLDTSRKSRYKGGTLVAEDVRDLAEHRRRLAKPDEYRPASCPRCGHDRVHVHCRPERHPCGDSSLPPVVEVLQFRCAAEACGATWRILPLFLARHLWHAWAAVERVVRLPPAPARAIVGPAIAARTQERWRARLASSARIVVAILATSVAVVLEGIAKSVGLLGTRGEVLDAFIVLTAPPPSDRLSSLAALVHRLERGVRLM